MRKIISNIIILSLALINIAQAQVILPLGLGQKNSENIICSSNDKLWVLSKNQNNFEVNKWDGNFWINYSQIPKSFTQQLSTNIDSIAAAGICYFKNELYAVFTAKASGKLLVIKNNGKFWEKINSDNYNSDRNLELLNTGNNLLLCGNITVNNVSVSIIKIESGNCTIYAPNPPDQGIDDYFTDFEYSDNKIWAIGLFATPFDPYNKAFKVFENNVWKSISNSPYNNGFEGFGKYNDSLIVTGVDFDGYINFSLKSNNWKEISNGLNDWKIKSVSDIHQIKNLLWVAGKFENDKLGKTSTLAYWNGNLWVVPSIDYLGSDIKLAGENEVYISGNFITHQGLILNKIGIIEPEKALLAGKVFYDNNQNCTQQIGENILQGVLVKIMPEDVYIPTDYNGNFYIPVDLKITQHIVNVETPKYYISTCGTKIINNNGQNTNAGLDFGIIPYGVHNDVSVSISDFTGWRARLGFDENYRICITNRGTHDLSEVNLEFFPDNSIKFSEFSILPDEINSKTIVWKIKNLKKGESVCINAKAKIPVELALGDKISHSAKASINELQDDDLTNNSDTLIQKIVAAIDPNDKTTKQDYKISTQTDFIDYKIRFQNTGYDTAYNIQVIDTLDPQFVISAQRGIIMSSSHKYELAPIAWIQNGKYHYKYAWIFRDVLLPDKNTNNELSQGYIDFKINFRDKLEVGTKITNRAYIYFDFQEPVITNDAVNIVENSTEIKNLNSGNIIISPNPASDYLNIKNPEQNELKISLINILGKTILNYSIPRQSSVNIDISNLKSGIYFIKAQGYSPLKFIKN